MSVLLLPFGKRISDDQIVSASDVPRGAACNCLCPECGVALIAKQGSEREWHFAHAKGAKCANGYEKSVHEYAKQLLRQRKLLWLPPLEAIAWDVDALGKYITEQTQISKGMQIQLDECLASCNQGDVTPDITGIYRGRKILIEITVFHRLMPDKLERLIATRIPVIEVDLSSFKTPPATKERLEQQLFKSDAKWHWLWHPRLEVAMDEVQARLNVRLAEARQQWEKKKSSAQSVLAAQSRHTSPLNEQTDYACLRKWRAGLPQRAQVERAVTFLALRIGCDEKHVLALTNTVKTRGQLVGLEPSDLAREWAVTLGIDTAEIEAFLDEAQYTWVRSGS